MLITASWEGGDVAVEVDEGCRSVGALRHTLAAAVPELDAEKVCLEIGGCAADDEAVCSLCEGSVVTVSVTPAVRAVAILQEEGWDVDFRGFCAAAAEGDMRLCELYLDAEVHRRVQVPGFWTPLHIACRNHNLLLCKLLIERGHPLDVRDCIGDTPLREAVRRASVELCTLLIDRGCSLDLHNGDGNTSLHSAVEAEFVEVCRLLIDKGCCLDVQNRYLWTPLHAAANAASVELCKLLIDGGCSLDVQDSACWTPLHAAVHAKSVEVCRLLLDSGAATNLTIAQRRSVFAIASRTRAVYKLLTDHGVSDPCAKRRCIRRIFCCFFP